MSFFSRIANLWRGFLSLFVKDLEIANPAAVYEAAIDERINKYKALKSAVSGIVMLRNKLSAEYEAAKKGLVEVNAQIPIAVESGDDEAALVLLEQKNSLEARMTSLEGELDKVTAQAEDAKAGLIQFQAEIKKLQREKEEMLAKKENAEARIKIQESISGLSVDADVKALENVRTSIEKLHAEADVSSEINGSSLDARLKKIKARTGNAVARSQLEEMKKQMGARQVAAQAAGGSKSL